MSEKFKYDVFLSHSSKDNEVIQRLAERLREDGIPVWFNEWERQKDNFPLRIQEALEESRILIFALSRNTFETEWASLERASAPFRNPGDSERRFIPILLEDCEIPETLRQFFYVDLRQGNEDQYQTLLSLVWEESEVEADTIENDTQLKSVISLKGHDRSINAVSVTPNGRLIVSVSNDETIWIWDTNKRKCIKILQGHSDIISAVAISDDGRMIVSGSRDSTIRIWETSSGRCLKILGGHVWGVNQIRISRNKKKIFSCGDDKTIRIWDVQSGLCISVLKGHTDGVIGLTTSYDNKVIVSASHDRTIRIWHSANGACINELHGHSDAVLGVAISTDSKTLISSSADSTLRIWDLVSGKCFKVLEGHSGAVHGVDISPDYKLIFSSSDDKTVRLWETFTGKCIKILGGHARSVRDVIFLSQPKLLVSFSIDRTILIRDVSPLLATIEIQWAQNVGNEAEEYKFYTNAKVLLVGDSGVGKSGLAYRLTQDRYIPTDSTDGVWATQLILPHEANTADTEREIWLWDFAGQSDYRLIHQLFMDETSLAVLVFNPQANNPFEGLGQWDRDLQRAARRSYNKVLVAGRCDRGGLTISQRVLDDFKSERNFASYIETSALTGTGCKRLRDLIIDNIDWEEIPHRASPLIFKLLKEQIVRLKDEGKILLRLSELKQNLEMRLSEQRFTFDEVKTVVSLLAGSGLVWELEFGDFVLLQPERVNSYAAAVVRSVRAHIDEIGSIPEEDVREGKLNYQDIERLESFEEDIVLRAMLQTFVKRGVCLREKTDRGAMLIFPSYFRRERPELAKHPTALVTYQFSGMLDEIYATLVVCLHNTKAFQKDQLWRYAADFKTESKKTVGLKMISKGEGSAEITIYFEDDIPDDTKATFIRYVHEHLKGKDQNVIRLRNYVCPHCHEPFEDRRKIDNRLNRGEKDIICGDCEKRFLIWDLIEEKFASDELGERIRKLEEEAKIEIDNESRELILAGDAKSIVAQAGHIYRDISNSDWGIDGEIEFKNYEQENGKLVPKASGRRVYLQLKSGDSHLRLRYGHEEIFDVKKERHISLWTSQAYPVMLVIRTSDGRIRWMNITEYFQKQGKESKQIVFDGEPFTASTVSKMWDKLQKQ